MMGFVFDGCTSQELRVQQRNGWAVTKGRLRREDCEFVKHDKLFSNWKILVGPSDWSEHAAAKDGTERYHLHNLPASHLGPGVYELGVTAPSWSPTSHTQRKRALKREDVMAVYVGQADNIRLRLQKYGQAGSHLEGSRSSKLYHQGDPEDSVDGESSQSFSRKSSAGPRLFSEVFALGSSIAFRWAQTDSKVVAERVELELLAVFDYAWNKGSNGNRRSRDILAKLFMAWPTNGSFCNPFASKKWLFCGTNAVGIKVALRKPQATVAASRASKSLCYLLTTPPPPVSVRTPVKVLTRCGATTEKGVPCTTPPVRGRKRCQQHKGMRVRAGAAAASVMKREPVKVVGGAARCIPKAFMGQFATKPRADQFVVEYKPDCKVEEVKAEPKEEAPVAAAPGERRRPLSLSFNTWMKMENERFHDSLDPAWSGSAENELESSFHRAIKQEHTSEIRRVRRIRSKYAPVPGDDSKRR